MLCYVMLCIFIPDHQIKASILQRLVSIQSDTSDGIKEVIRRQQSKDHSESEHSDFPRRQKSKRGHSDSEHSENKYARRQKSYKSVSESEQPGSPEKFNKSKTLSPEHRTISRQASKVDGPLEMDPSAQLIEEEELETGRVSRTYSSLTNGLFHLFGCALFHGWKVSGLFLNSGFWGWLSTASHPQNAESRSLY